MTAEVVRFERVWAMPNRWTFLIPPIASLLSEYVVDHHNWVDPFCGRSGLAATRNDIRFGGVDARVFLDALDTIPNCLFDPPYSPRQISECYKEAGRSVTKNDTQNSVLYSQARNLIARKMPRGGIVISFGWNTAGMGINRGYQLERVLLVCHGAAHNDTLVTIERRV